MGNYGLHGNDLGKAGEIGVVCMVRRDLKNAIEIGREIEESWILWQEVSMPLV